MDFWTVSAPAGIASAGARYTGARPKPATTRPAIRPVFDGGNHFSAGGVADE